MIDIREFTYNLPNERIAKYPLGSRDESKLLVYRNGNIDQSIFLNLSNILENNDFLIFNNTRVIPARLQFKKESGALIEIFCLNPYSPSDYNHAFQQTNECTWKCMVGNLKKWKDPELINQLTVKETSINIKAIRVGKDGNDEIIKFRWNNEGINFSDILTAMGQTPIPPYLNRSPEEVDKERYQTLYSQINGSVAAPTAGLHFSAKVFSSLSNKGINHDYITLHVGAGTFQPIKESNALEHEMHKEPFILSLPTLQNIISHLDNILAIGTTSLRTLESIYWLGVRLKKGIENFTVDQWIWRNEKPIPTTEAMEAVLNYMQTNQLLSLWVDTQIMITPGYTFHIPKAIVTNFHQPNSTLLLLVAAIIGDDWKKVYEYAMQNNFRFLSYGDSSLLYI